MSFITPWLAAWMVTATMVGVTPEMLQQRAGYLEARERLIHEMVVEAPASRPHTHRHRSLPGSVEQWRPLVEAYFPSAQVTKALRVLECESRGDPRAYNRRSGASGLFQHLAKYWDQRSAAAGWAGADIFDPEANIAVAAWLWRWGGWGHWTCA